MNNLLAEIEYVNKTENHMVGNEDIFETRYDNPGDMYRHCLRFYGKCVSKVYIDKGDKTIAVGWVFHKRTKYEDSKETYLQETWVTLYEAMPEKRITHHYKELTQ